VLLLGYLYADILTRRRSPRHQTFLHIALLLLSLLFLPLNPNPWWQARPNQDPTWRILGLLTTALGLPYLLLSATTPLVQSWYARSEDGSQPYRFFAISNFASLLALVAYPVVLEPTFSTLAAALAWSFLYAVFAALCLSSSWTSRNVEPIVADIAHQPHGSPDTKRKLLWLSLSACGSMLLLSVTNHLCANVAPIPLLWVLPLALYLLTFVLAFSRQSWYPQSMLHRALVIALISVGYAISDIHAVKSIQLSVPLFCLGLFIACLFCHGELNRLRPEPAHLTGFYLMISLGGALGAVFVGLFAPRLFSNLYELPLALMATAVLATIVVWREAWETKALWITVTVAMAVVLVTNIRAYQSDSLLMVRSFYGALRVTQSGSGPEEQRSLFHGTIRHGAQFVHAPLSHDPTTYYTEESGVGFALRLCCDGPKRVGVIGLGVGTLAAYGHPGDIFRFYEINPQVVQIAHSLFTFLRDSPAKINIELGDARLTLANETPQHFDVLVIDAFSGDAIPLHLLTKEAMALYFRHLAPNGILAFHTSNRYVRLAPVIEKLAAFYGYSARQLVSVGDQDLVSTAEWVLVTRNRNFLRNEDVLRATQSIQGTESIRLWTDDYSNLFSVLRIFKQN
jgi:hypothetical protein